jgi:hypothetical protein
VSSLKLDPHRDARVNGERRFAHPAYAYSGPLAWFESEAETWLAADAHHIAGTVRA